jgi:hypothetical protein
MSQLIPCHVAVVVLPMGYLQIGGYIFQVSTGVATIIEIFTEVEEVSLPSSPPRHCCPPRLVAVSGSGNQIAVAGQRGLCLLNLLTGKRCMFGNVSDEQDMSVFAISAIFSRVNATMRLKMT